MNQSIFEPAAQIPVLAECDVLVVGGGPAGIAAAIGAARTGAKTIVVERYGCLGGILTTCSMETPAWWRDEKAVMPGGIFAELDDRLVKAGLSQHCFFRPGTGRAYDTEALKYVADELMEENGAVSILHCLGVSPAMDGNQIKGIVTESKSGRQAILAKRVVDCTGDADIAARAGAAFVSADEPTGSIPADQLYNGTIVYGLSNVDTKRFIEDVDRDPMSRHPILHRLCHRYLDEAERDGIPVPEGMRKGFVYNMVEPDALPALNQTQLPVDGTDVISLTQAEILGREAIMKTIPIYRKYAPGMEHARLRYFSMGLGVRETRRIVGEYTLNVHDIFESKSNPESIGVYPFCCDGAEGTIPAATDRHFQVPYRITVPQTVENLLVAGRCVSAQRRCYGVSRMVNFAMVTGQAAGTASAVAIKENVSSRNVNIADLQRELQHQGVKIK